MVEQKSNRQLLLLCTVDLLECVLWNFAAEGSAMIDSVSDQWVPTEAHSVLSALSPVSSHWKYPVFNQKLLKKT